MNNIILSLITDYMYIGVLCGQCGKAKLFDIWELELELGTPPLGVAKVRKKILEVGVG